MQAPDKHQVKTSEVTNSSFPKGHILAAGALALGLIAWAASSPSKQSHPDTVAINLTPAPSVERADILPKSELNPAPLNTEANVLDIALAEKPSAKPVEPAMPTLEQRSFTVRSGDSLSTIFKRAGLSDRDVYELTHSCPEAKSLTRIMPGHKIVFYLDEAGALQKLSHITDRLNSTHFEKSEASYVSIKEIKQPEVRTAYKEATISSSLYMAAVGVSMPESLIMEMANVFGWDIDFALDLRKGDHFSVLYEEKFLDGEKIGHGAILAAEFTNQGDKFKAVRYTHANGEAHYYTPNGESMRKAFLLAPVDFRRISGNFNPKRLHPIFKTVRPHRGTDYAANRGTPVWASGDGRVTAAGYSKANGNYVFIQHGNNVVTKYLHLHKRFVKKGQRVKQKQSIGTVGSTGYATGPHLHYEFLLDGVHRNPRTIVQKLPKAKSINDGEMQDFLSQTQPLMASLEQRFNASRLAMGTTDRNIN
ncbi:peptidoglycan DD-metalloendopeptidase family protein [Gilvimarinus sp. SDUM040013]|uniref:Peptidoglycan DD-metalloendopeptidase family protein n=1 Tax=Gilvimarinus gilvus TaxID=3058038 RepID=A0ABU4RUL3_9GAMM|nr:peptidoglycan DD-metalloendopeptidase family protein [Gilvimarinus sp. SDUM040013]MDO3386711.1 peptidoglycan DD-metalloendopeptidase family protein [Gilvimarinus sp. SDUM040013]MDX6848359.1 peptidoglycan DD-metalloendopeptidase family protein [Gilvimarinus sp. SDUM040013]